MISGMVVPNAFSSRPPEVQTHSRTVGEIRWIQKSLTGLGLINYPEHHNVTRRQRRKANLEAEVKGSLQSNNNITLATDKDPHLEWRT